MGRQWLHAKRLVAGAKKAKTNTKLVREITLAAKMGGADPTMNARLFAAVEKAKKDSVPKDAIQRAINKGAGVGDDKLTLEYVVYEGRAPHNVPVIIEVYTDNVQRTAPEIRVLFRKGQLASSGANKFVFDNVGLVEAHHPDATIDPEEAAIEAGANEVEPLTRDQNDDIPVGAAGAKFICERTEVANVSKWLAANGWTVITSEIGFIAKTFSELTEAQQEEVGDFLHALDEHDDVHRVWAAIK
ncbi:YebC/PmpR family DNA-binding transcriptional regulator [Humisphaera borealis]|uniref:YebC/PmpR family DNA-binding transcriptional regulator n=1 Tax=Humisphaera borealis TaxID=2807512 RepID=A0A7M2WPB8_9BACT|nr:YebC/PmpR family DNA-binding transcriptional regulator [Humisphaera borealis]QOV87377.1 YebC/PmpR family DNA-binding transcriptional regulator [Humisphaera borealis]